MPCATLYASFGACSSQNQERKKVEGGKNDQLKCFERPKSTVANGQYVFLIH
jgi:hypothetical protein